MRIDKKDEKPKLGSPGTSPEKKNYNSNKEDTRHSDEERRARLEKMLEKAERLSGMSKCSKNDTFGTTSISQGSSNVGITGNYLSNHQKFGAPPPPLLTQGHNSTSGSESYFSNRLKHHPWKILGSQHNPGLLPQDTNKIFTSACKEQVKASIVEISKEKSKASFSSSSKNSSSHQVQGLQSWRTPNKDRDTQQKKYICEPDISQGSARTLGLSPADLLQRKLRNKQNADKCKSPSVHSKSVPSERNKAETKSAIVKNISPGGGRSGKQTEKLSHKVLMKSPPNSKSATAQMLIEKMKSVTPTKQLLDLLKRSPVKLRVSLYIISSRHFTTFFIFNSKT